MRLKAAIEGDLRQIIKGDIERVSAVSRRAADVSSFNLQTKLRAQVDGAGLGQGLSKAWRRELYPRSASKDTLGSAALVYSKATKLHAAFNEGGIIRSSRGWLAIPTEEAVRLGFATQMVAGLRGSREARKSDIEAAERRFGKLRAIQTHNGNYLLVADVRTGTRLDKKLGQRVQTYRKTRENQSATTTVPLFYLVQNVRLQKKLDLDSATTAAFNEYYSLLSGSL